MPEKKEDILPTYDDLQKDPMAALTKGFGWFTTTVTKTAKTVNDGYIQPTASKVCFPSSHGRGFLSPHYSRDIPRSLTLPV